MTVFCNGKKYKNSRFLQKQIDNCCVTQENVATLNTYVLPHPTRNPSCTPAAHDTAQIRFYGRSSPIHSCPSVTKSNFFYCFCLHTVKQSVSGAQVETAVAIMESKTWVYESFLQLSSVASNRCMGRSLSFLFSPIAKFNVYIPIIKMRERAPDNIFHCLEVAKHREKKQKK